VEDASTYLEVGAAGMAEERAGGENLASRYGSGALEVYATPAMVALMEGAAVDAVQGALPAGWTTVGISVDVRHLDVTPPGLVVRAEATLKAVKGLRLVFDVRAEDASGLIGEGVHQRYCVEAESFLARARQKDDSPEEDRRDGQ